MLSLDRFRLFQIHLKKIEIQMIIWFSCLILEWVEMMNPPAFGHLLLKRRNIGAKIHAQYFLLVSHTLEAFVKAIFFQNSPDNVHSSTR